MIDDRSIGRWTEQKGKKFPICFQKKRLIFYLF